MSTNPLRVAAAAALTCLTQTAPAQGVATDPSCWSVWSSPASAAPR